MKLIVTRHSSIHAVAFRIGEVRYRVEIELSESGPKLRFNEGATPIPLDHLDAIRALVSTLSRGTPQFGFDEEVGP